MSDAVPASASPQPWPRQVLFAFLIFVLAAAAAGFLYENIFEARDRRFNPMPGHRFDVGGFKMHIDCTGEGSPAVILESGLGDTYISWRKVQPQVAKLTRVCSYDRAGLGYSDPSPHPRTSENFAQELHALLKAAGVAPPYVLVGHSLGGFGVRIFTSLYRNEVAGLVLVDSSHPDQVNRLPPAIKDLDGSELRQAEFLTYTMPFGIPRLLGLCEDDPMARAAECNLHTARETVAERKALTESAAQTAASGSLGDLPLIVLSHDPDRPAADLPADLAGPANEAWEKMQEELEKLSTHGTQTIARNSAHYIQIDRPDVVIESIRSVVGQARSAPPAAASKP